MCPTWRILLLLLFAKAFIWLAEGVRVILLLLSRDLFLLHYLLFKMLFLLTTDERGSLRTCRLGKVNTWHFLRDHLLSCALTLRWAEEERFYRVMASYVVSRSQELLLKS